MERLDQILKDLGLDDAMVVVFEYMADRRRATLEQLYDGTRLSRRAILMATEALEAKGALKREGPYFIVESLQESLNAMAPARFDEIKAEIRSYRQAPDRAECCPMVELVAADVADMSVFITREFASAVGQVDVISHMLEWLDEETMDSIESAVQRGVRVRILTFEHPEIESDVRALRDAGAEVRTDEYATRMQLMIVDGMAMAIDLPGPPRVSKYPSLRVRDPESCECMEEVFKLAWNDAESPEK